MVLDLVADDAELRFKLRVFHLPLQCSQAIGQRRAGRDQHVELPRKHRDVFESLGLALEVDTALGLGILAGLGLGLGLDLRDEQTLAAQDVHRLISR